MKMIRNKQSLNFASGKLRPLSILAERFDESQRISCWRNGVQSKDICRLSEVIACNEVIAYEK